MPTTVGDQSTNCGRPHTHIVPKKSQVKTFHLQAAAAVVLTVVEKDEITFNFEIFFIPFFNSTKFAVFEHRSFDYSYVDHLTCEIRFLNLGIG